MGAGDLEFRRMVLFRGRILGDCERVCFFGFVLGMGAEDLYGLGMVRGRNSTLHMSSRTVYACEFMFIVVCFIPS